MYRLVTTQVPGTASQSVGHSPAMAPDGDTRISVRGWVQVPSPVEVSFAEPGSRASISSVRHSHAMRELPVFVMVSGPPASGKSTLAPEIAAALRLPLVAKDVIKEALMDTLPVPDVAASRQLGRAAVQAMLAVSAASPVGAVLESNFYRTLAVAGYDSCLEPWSRSSAVATEKLRRAASRLESLLAMRDTLTASAPPRSCGTSKSVSRWPADGRSWRSTRTVPSTCPSLLGASDNFWTHE